MSTTGILRSSALRRSVALALVLALLLFAMPLATLGQDSSTAIRPYIITLQPGESIEIEVHGFCLNYGLPFPGAVLLPTELASDPLRNTAVYGLANSYIDNNALDVERAIWYLFDGTRLDGHDYTLADKIIAYANSGVQPADVVAGVPHMVELVTAGSLTASISEFVNVSPEQGAFFGSGTLTITNISQEPQQFVVSYGTVTVDETDGDLQNMLVFPSQPAPATPTPTATPAPTQTATPTATQAPTATATSTPPPVVGMPDTGGAPQGPNVPWTLVLIAIAGVGLGALAFGSRRLAHRPTQQ